MIIGEYLSKIGDKKRLAIPKKIREELGDNLILTRGYEGSLILVNKEMWSKLASEVVNGSFINKNIRDTTRFLVGSAVEIAPDNQGRIVVPSSLYSHANFNKEAIFIGLINWVEVWDKTKWEERLKYLEENGEDIANEIAAMKEKKDGE